MNLRATAKTQPDSAKVLVADKTVLKGGKKEETVDHKLDIHLS